MDWFDRALATPFMESSVTVRGARVHYLRWPNPGKAGLVLIHGGAAHAHWWTFLAPLLGHQYDVIALDLTGHGDSDRRERYPREWWAEEVLCVAQEFPGPPVVIGHSLGGLVAIVTAALFGDKLAGAIIVDSPVDAQNPESRAAKASNVFRAAKIYPDEQTALRHFHLVPDQPCADRRIFDYVAKHSLRVTPEGVRWKFDPRIFAEGVADRMDEYLAQVRCRVALLRGEFSAVVSPETGAFMYDLLNRNSPLVEIPEAHHHLPLDQPLAFVAAVRALLADWEHSTPK